MNNIEVKQLRLWPGVVIVVLQWLVRFVLPPIVPEAIYYSVIGGVAGGLAIVLWWVLLSRAPWAERLTAVILMIAALFATSRIIHVSLATGAQGMLFPILAVPVLSLAFVMWAVSTRYVAGRIRYVTMAATIVIACGAWALVKTGGFTAGMKNDLQWRWAKTSEERLLARESKEQFANEPAAQPAAPEISEKPLAPEPAKGPAAALPAPETEKAPGPAWPGFRGARRDDVLPGVRINADWATSPPIALWRRAIGPGWSSFAASGNLLYTQEQRGPDEIVACYRISTGKPVWAHRDAARFWESNGGPGPRGTPTLSNGRVYTFGATGILNALRADTGAVAWSRNAAADAGIETPQWGFASSPLITGDLVIVAAGGRLAAYDKVTGAQRWLGPSHGMSYSSPHLLTIDGVAQVVLLSGSGATGVAVPDGTLLWEHRWEGGTPIVQPALTAEGDILVAVSSTSGIRRLAIGHSSTGWTAEERWTSIGLKPYFNDFVVHNGYAYGFDGSILACIDLKDGTRKWKGGRYGNGQLMLLPDQDLLLLSTEEGDLALVRAAPDQFTELARVRAIEGKTWNHPVLFGDTLLVRNGQEMAAFRLAK